MTNQDIQQMTESRIAELNATAEQKKQELKQQLSQEIAKSEIFLTSLKNEQERLANQLSLARENITTLEQPLQFDDIIHELEQALTQENVDLEELSKTTQHSLQESMNQQMNDLKAKLLSSQQDLIETLKESQAKLAGTPAPAFWLKLNTQFQVRFGDKIQKVKIKLAEQLESCAGKLKA